MALSLRTEIRLELEKRVEDHDEEATTVDHAVDVAVEMMSEQIAGHIVHHEEHVAQMQETIDSQDGPRQENMTQRTRARWTGFTIMFIAFLAALTMTRIFP